MTLKVAKIGNENEMRFSDLFQAQKYYNNFKIKIKIKIYI